MGYQPGEVMASEPGILGHNAGSARQDHREGLELPRDTVAGFSAILGWEKYLEHRRETPEPRFAGGGEFR